MSGPGKQHNQISSKDGIKPPLMSENHTDNSLSSLGVVASSSSSQAELIRSVRLTIVRHGQTMHNKMRVIQGQMESQLTELGKEQAKLLGRYLLRKQVKFDWVYSSDLTRSLETCQIICDNCRTKDMPNYVINQTKALRERSYGDYQGLTGDEMRRRAFKAGLNPNDVATFRPEGGESIGDVTSRIKQFFFTELFPKLKHLNRVLIVSHGGFIRETMRLFLKHGCVNLDLKDLVITQNSALNNFDVHLKQDNSIASISARRIHKIPHLTFNVLNLDDNPRGEHSDDDEEIDLTNFTPK